MDRDTELHVPHLGGRAEATDISQADRNGHREAIAGVCMGSTLETAQTSVADMGPLAGPSCSRAPSLKRGAWFIKQN